jgi:hypothetical protein
MKSNEFLYLGAETWSHPAWFQVFYPEGLPEEWVLSFYNTRFQTVFLPADTWRGQTPEVWRQWLNDTQERFVFILEECPRVSPPASGRVQMATATWLTAHVWWLDEAPDLRALSRRIAAHAASGEPLFIISRRGDLGLLGQVEDLRQVMGY